ncbi:MAG: hypothetical protein Q7U44_03870, partial [Desulfuromonadales bacterium]|nr:hypothetical protein [Desulfuromonadales bacterium]
MGKMSSLAHWYSLCSALIAIPLIGIVSIVFHFKNKIASTLILAIGLNLVVLGGLIQIFTGAGEATLDEMGNFLSSSGPPISLYLGSIISSTGLLVTVVGFALVAF